MQSEEEKTEYGQATAGLLHSVFADGVDRAVLLMRHSAREYVPDRHDLENPLTEAGRAYAWNLGQQIPRHLTLRGYASPPHRCMETAERVLAGHAARGGAITRHRPLEALGVFYALDQIRMWKGMRAAGGLPAYVQDWLDGSVPGGTMIDPDVATGIILRVMTDMLAATIAEAQLDVCVSHDMTLYLMRASLFGDAPGDHEVAYLDGVVLYQQAGELRLRNAEGADVTVG